MKSSLTTGEMAKYCGVNHRTVLRWIKAGHLEAFQLPGRGDHRVPVETCIAFLKKHDIPVPQELSDKNDGPRRILIVEDEPQMASLIELCLKREGYETQLASDGFQAGALLGTFQPHLMTLDLSMPRLNGMGVLQYLKKDPRHGSLKILVVSGLDKPSLQAAVDAGADVALAKPFESADLIKHVRNLLDKNA